MPASTADDDASEKINLLGTVADKSTLHDPSGSSSRTAVVSISQAGSPDGDDGETVAACMDAAPVLPPRLPRGWRGNIRWLIALLGFSMELVCYADRTNLSLALVPMAQEHGALPAACRLPPAGWGTTPVRDSTT